MLFRRDADAGVGDLEDQLGPGRGRFDGQAGDDLARGRELQVERRHAASVMEPARTDRLCHADHPGSLLRQQPFGDLLPERHLDMTLEPRRTRRPQLWSNRPIRCLLTTSHSTPP